MNMRRFRAEKYDPVLESSRGAEQVGQLTLKRDDGRCECGCNELVSTNSRFRMGHDARLKGKLLRAHLTKTPVVLVFGNSGVVSKPMTALELATSYNRPTHRWSDTLEEAETKYDERLRLIPTAPGGGANRKSHEKVGARIIVPDEEWEYTGQITKIYGDCIIATYQTRTGQTRTARIPTHQEVHQ